MSLAQLFPPIRSLSRSDKLRLIQWIAADLAGTDEPTSMPADQTAEIEDEEEIREDERVQTAVRKVGLRNALGRMAEEP